MAYKFKSKLIKFPGTGGWTFAEVPKKFSPPFKLEWGRTPVNATVDGKKWKTSVWTEKSGRILLPVPKNIRGDKTEGGFVSIELDYLF
jgi:hypothetical protein